MSTISTLTANHYQLADEVFFGLYAEQQTSSAYLKKPNSGSLSVHALNFAMLNGLTYLVLCMIEIFQKNIKVLNEERTLHYQLSPLHIAILIQRRDFVSALVNAGVDIDVRDHRDWTPLHHAALMGDKENIQFLKAHGADKDVLTDFEGTYRDILRLTSDPQQNGTDIIPIVLKTTDGKVEALTHQKFKDLTRACYLEENYAERSWLIQQWKEPTYKHSAIMDPLFSRLKEQYKREFHTSPNFEMQKITCDDSQRKLDSSPGFGLFAAKSYEKGDILGEYKAHIGPEDLHDEYTMDKWWQARHYRNAMAMINDGYPNTHAIKVVNVRGLPFRMLMVAISPIEKGEQICFNYGTLHLVKVQSYAELRGEALRKMINSFDPKTKKRSKDPFPQWQLKYVSDTPIVLFNIIWDGSVTIQKAMDFINYLYQNDRVAFNDRQSMIRNVELALAIKNTYLIKETDKNKFTETINHLKKKVDALAFCKLLFTHLPKIAKEARLKKTLALPKEFTEPDVEKKIECEVVNYERLAL